MATGFRLADPREYRRGVILGLTLAEILTLLVFLLLLSSGALLARRNREVHGLQAKLASVESQLAPVIEEMRKNGIAVRNLDDLASRLERATHYDEARQEIAQAQSALAEARAALEKSAREADELRAKLERIPQDQRQMADKAAQADAMSTALSQAGAAGGSPQEKLQAVLARSARAEKAEKANRDLTGQNEQMRIEIARVKGNGGSGLPYCWATLDGHPEFMLRVDLHDDDVVVSEMSPRPRPDDPVWQLLDAIPRDQPIAIATLISEVRPLAHDAAAKKCRYAVKAFDGTGRTNKVGYKYLMGRLWSVFMVQEIR